MKNIIHRFDKIITRQVQHVPKSWDTFFLFMTQLGDPVTVVGIAIATAGWAVLGLKNTKVAYASLMIPATLLFGSGLKLLFERARPLSEFSHTLRLDTFSFPSGHSTGSMIAYGFLAYIVLHVVPGWYGVVAAIVLALVPIFVGVSRIYLGVHYPSDVFAGWLLGLIGLAIVICVLKPFA